MELLHRGTGRGRVTLVLIALVIVIAMAVWGIAFFNRGATPAEAEPTLDGRFTFAVMPDTQLEVVRDGDTRFANRTQWLVDNRSLLDLRFVTHSGDVVNWDTPGHGQYAVASAALRILQDARIPYALAVGNHDTAAVKPGGSALDPSRTHQLVRDTKTFNAYFTAADFGAVQGQFEPDKVDNAFSTYEAGGLRWLVLTLELWPRAAVVEWAKTVLAEHPRHNVVLVTHDYLTSTGAIEQRADYGDVTPQYLFDHLVSQYPNVRMVFSGHVGGAVAERQDVGRHGNRIYSFMQSIHDEHTNPVRLVEVDTVGNSIRTWVYAPYTRQSYPAWERRVAGVQWVR